MTNHVRGFDLTPFVKQYGAKLLAKAPWIGDVIRREIGQSVLISADELRQ